MTATAPLAAHQTSSAAFGPIAVTSAPPEERDKLTLSHPSNPTPTYQPIDKESRKSHGHKFIETVIRQDPLPSEDRSAERSNPEVLPSLLDADRILRDADSAAVQGTNDGTLTWEQAHDQWESKTRRDLSPHAFGKRILDLGGGLRTKLAAASMEPASGRRSTSQSHAGTPPTHSTPGPTNAVPSIISATPARGSQPPLLPQPVQQYPPRYAPLQQSPLPIQPRSSSHQPSPSSMSLQSTGPQLSGGGFSGPPPLPQSLDQDASRRQQQDIDSIKYELRLVQHEMHSLALAVHEIKNIVSERGTDEGVDGLFDTVSQHATKLGELESLKLQIASLQRRAKMTEGTSPLSQVPPTSLPNGISPNMPTPVHSHAPPPAHAQLPAYTPIQNLKRHQPSDILETNKRYKTDSLTPRTSSPTLSHPEHPNSSSLRVRHYVPHQAPTSGGHPVSRQSTESDGSWQHSEAPDTSAPSFTPANAAATSAPAYAANPPSARARGRPRRNQDPPVTQWDQRGKVPIAPDGYWRQEHYDSTSDRGRIVRRGGSMMSIQGEDRESMAARDGRSRVKTRARPVRGADGVLRRKDGKPDMRSQSSAKNLALIQQRKRAEREEKEGDRRASGADSTVDDPALDEDEEEEEEEDDDDDKLGYSDDEGENLEAEGDDGEGQDGDEDGQDPKHAKVMKQMFPNGISTERNRMNHAARVFSPSNSAAASGKMLPRKEMVKEDADDATDNNTKPPPPATLEILSKTKGERPWTEESARTRGYASLQAMEVEARLAQEDGDALSDFEELVREATASGQCDLVGAINGRRERMVKLVSSATATGAAPRAADDDDEMMIEVEEKKEN